MDSFSCHRWKLAWTMLFCVRWHHVMRFLISCAFGLLSTSFLNQLWCPTNTDITTIYFTNTYSLQSLINQIVLNELFFICFLETPKRKCMWSWFLIHLVLTKLLCWPSCVHAMFKNVWMKLIVKAMYEFNLWKTHVFY